VRARADIYVKLFFKKKKRKKKWPIESTDAERKTKTKKKRKEDNRDDDKTRDTYRLPRNADFAPDLHTSSAGNPQLRMQTVKNKKKPKKKREEEITKQTD